MRESPRDFNAVMACIQESKRLESREAKVSRRIRVLEVDTPCENEGFLQSDDF